ncbi:MAG: polyprenyl synthetase family protein [Gaiellaceae bacterium]
MTTSLPTDALAIVQAAPGLREYLEAVEARLHDTVESHGGTVAEAGAQALMAGGKRLRPLLAFLSAPAGMEPPVEAGVAVELVHLASLVHDDLLDGAEIRRGVPSAWQLFGERVASAAGDYLFARAFAELTLVADARAVSVLARAARALVRGEALQQSQVRDPGTRIEDYLTRCTLKTGSLFEAACLLGAGTNRSRLGAYGVALGVAFQIVDDVLDCSGTTIETGKVPGTDLRDGVPTLPLLLASGEDELVREALAGGSVDGALVRIAASGALERSRETALDYARRARACLDGEARRHELEALTYAVVERKG